jgi:hypothetical protein
MSDPDRDAKPEARANPGYDNPADRYGAYTEWPVERATPADEDAMDAVADEYERELESEDLEWLGFTGGGSAGAAPYLYDPQRAAVYEGEIDEENERVILRDADRHELDSERSLGEQIEEFGEEHDWEWLSSFAREHLEDDGDRGAGPTDESATGPGELALRDSEFNERNVAATDSQDLSYFGSHTLVDESGTVHVLEREFDVYADDTQREQRADVRIDEDFLVAEPPAEERREGDADLIAERERQLTVEVDRDEFGWENLLEEELREWHESHVEWPREE